MAARSIGASFFEALFSERASANRRAWQTTAGSDVWPRQGIACHRPLAGDGASPWPQAASCLSGSAFTEERVEF